MIDIVTRALSLIAIVGIGLGIKRLGWATKDDFRLLSRVVLGVTLPCALFTSFNDYHLDYALLGLVVLVWFRNPALAAVIAVALTLNFTFAALGGVLVPVTLKRFGFDPALAGGVILTTVTDTLGFLTFLGLATLILLQ